MGLGLICCGLAESVGTLIAAYGGLFGLGLGLTYGACITTAVRYFPASLLPEHRKVPHRSHPDMEIHRTDLPVQR